ncbi:MAG: hypothetical protein WA134_03785 [Rhodoferax sp.]
MNIKHYTYRVTWSPERNLKHHWAGSINQQNPRQRRVSRAKKKPPEGGL